ncbi:AI-2E family transporter [Microlunatus parietis]|uniref:Putative PurR-regulated permease PerM n=1 Tax=Microlunatus parietis TaxID=682979 RepID=A0A7Y9I523_9ACTN|nr:AI-2E family transporter [Microlunatus parietis]NYE70404.1 putative PurR-regulated permease PerM [Microlunatus parietis]
MVTGKRVRSGAEPIDPPGKRASGDEPAPESGEDHPRRADPASAADQDQRPDGDQVVDFMPPTAGTPVGKPPVEQAPAAETQLEEAPVVEPPVVPLPPDGVPHGLKIAAGWAWRVLLVAALVLGLAFLFQFLSEVTIPLAIATLLTALLSPVASRLRKWRVPRALAAAISVVGGLALLAGVLTFIVQQIVRQAGELATSAIQGYQQLLTWVAGPPLNIDSRQLADYGNQVLAWIQTIDLAAILPGYAAGVGSGVGHFLAGFAICLFALFYFLYDGRGVFTALLRFVPRAARPRADAAARNGWNSLVSYVRATIAVAFVDAIGVLIIALILRVPLAIPLAALVFLAAFIPLVGALVSGFVAVAVALVAVGPIQALIMLIGIIVVMQVESHVLQPFLLGRAVALHPLAVLLAIAIGVILGGIVGALLAVPLLAFAKTYISSLAAGSESAPAVVKR